MSCAAAVHQLPAATDRAIALTFDDLPSSRSGSLADMKDINARLLATLRAHGITATGFANEIKLAASGEEADRTALLEAWLAAGHDLGNHTYAHLRFYDTPLAEMEADVLRGERITRPLMAAHGRRPRYFRHPTLNTGRDSLSRAAFEQFLTANGYAVAPVTIDNDEYLYAAAYDRARTRGDRAARDRIGAEYLRYMETVCAYYEPLSSHLFGREIAQVLLLHANSLNAAYLDGLVTMLRGRGYRFVTLGRALEDPAYRSRDTYIGPKGISWLQRWAITRGEDPGDQPAAPDWVREAAQ
jgi:peptidoglycan/xylan/chitin deacetylase (PgdA/CDA1 family)